MVYILYILFGISFLVICVFVSVNVCVYVGEGLRRSFAKPNHFVLVNKICLNQLYELHMSTMIWTSHISRPVAKLFCGGGSNRSNFGTFYDYAWIILRSRWTWPFWGGVR